MQDLGGLLPYGSPFDVGGQFVADVGYGMAAPGGRGTETPYAGLTQSRIGYRAMRYGQHWKASGSTSASRVPGRAIRRGRVACARRRGRPARRSAAFCSGARRRVIQNGGWRLRRCGSPDLPVSRHLTCGYWIPRPVRT